jgi:hypothetical protein
MKKLLLSLVLLFSSFYSLQAQWAPVGTGFFGGALSPYPRTADVEGMITYNNDLYVWGDFDSVDGILAKNYARYDGTQWHALPFTGFARDMEVFKGELYIAGYTGINGLLPNRHITKWDGTNWTALDTTYINVVTQGENGPRDLEVYKGNLYLGGRSFNIGGPQGFPWQGTFNHVGLAKWTGTMWDSIENGYMADGTDYYFSLHKDSLIIMSSWDEIIIPGFDPSYWFYYDGINWHQINQGWIGAGPGVQLGNKYFRAPGQVGLDSGQINFSFASHPPSGSIILHRDKVISIKSFSTIQITDSLLNYILLDSPSIEGSSPPSSGFIQSICVYNDTLYAGGNFEFSNGTRMNGIMKWQQNMNNIVTSVQTEIVSHDDINVFPNPSSSIFNVVGQFKDRTAIDVFTMHGIKVKTITGEKNSNLIQINMSGSPSGIYLLKINTSDSISKIKIIKL